MPGYLFVVLKKLDLFFVLGYFARMYLHAHIALRRQKTALDPLEQELWMTVNDSVDAGT